MIDIYSLCDPDTGDVKYIGKANCADKRFKTHMYDCKTRNTPVYQWIRSLLKLNKIPQMRIIEKVSESDWQEKEKYYISKYSNLLNVAKGGNEPYCSTETRKNNGRNVAMKIHHGKSYDKEIWSLKQKMGVLLKNGYVSEKTKTKLRNAAKKNPKVFGCYANI